jgi:glutathione S-transferase
MAFMPATVVRAEGGRHQTRGWAEQQSRRRDPGRSVQHGTMTTAGRGEGGPALRLFDYAASPNCLKVRILLAELGLPYERVPIDILGGDTLTDDYGRVNPARRTPVLEGPFGCLPESNAILWYLAEGTDQLPDEPLRRAEVVAWLLFEQVEVGALGTLRFRQRITTVQLGESRAARLRATTVAALDTVDDRLSTRPFLVDDHSIADIACYAYLHVAPEVGLDLAGWPHVAAWIERVEAQPGFVNDLEPLPEEIVLGRGLSIYG